MGSRGKTGQPAGELVFGVNNPAVFLRKILGLFSMAKRQNSSMQAALFSRSAHQIFFVLCSIVINLLFHYIKNMIITYKTQGVCARSITFDKDESGKITNISFEGGCNGNLKAISKLCDGMTADEIAAKLKGNTCGFKSTSCADQLAIAVSK